MFKLTLQVIITKLHAEFDGVIILMEILNCTVLSQTNRFLIQNSYVILLHSNIYCSSPLLSVKMYRILRPTVQGSSVLLRSRALRRFATAPAGPLARYRELVEAGAVSEDEQQLATLQSFDRLYRELVVYRPPGLAPAFTPRAAPAKKEESFWGSLFSSKPDPKPDIVHTPASVASPNGIYLYGGPGCGKTFMMDLFYETLPLERKRRIHFNDFMIETHKQLHLLKRSSSRADYILDSVTDDLIKKHYVLCFDEFQVSVRCLYTSLCTSHSCRHVTYFRSLT